ncbi:hypothetical protein J7L81_05650, partial [Candidatus Aerophobetes bacterium]|nr:hypothetical protein [Candidatus Aerophobetes bacterium]
MDIYQLLPLLDGWERDAKFHRGIIVSKDKDRQLIKVTDSGWINEVFVLYIGSPNCRLNIVYHDRTGRRHKVPMSTLSAYYAGYIGLTQIKWITLTYAKNNVYAMTFNP